MSKWTINAYTFTSEGSSYPYTIGFHTADLTDHIISGKLVITIDDTSKVTFTIPYMQGKDLYQGQTLIDIKYGNDRKFFGTIVKKNYENESGIYTFEVTGVLGTYQFMPNYDGYGVDTIENYLATEMSRFKGTASAPYADSNPWTELYTGHNEIPSTFGDIETENLSLIPAFNINLQNTASSSYEFIKLITRQKNYIIPQNVYPKGALHLFEIGEKVYFKRIRQMNSQTVKYDDNLISYSYSRDTSPSKVRAYNTVDVYPSEGGYNSERYPIPFYYQRVNLSPKTDGSGYTIDEIANESSKIVSAKRQNSYTAYAFDKHLIDNTIPWIEIDKYVSVTLFVDGTETTTVMTVAQITYDLVDATKSSVKLGNISNAFITGSEQESQDFQAALKDRLQTSGGTMTGGITFDENGNNAEIDTTEISLRDRYALTCNLLDSSLIEQGAIDGSTGASVDWSARIRSGFTPIKPNTTYTVSWSGSAIPCMFYYSSSKTFVSASLTNTEVTSYTFTTPSGVGFVKFTWGKYSNANITPSDVSNVQLEKGSTASSYVPYTMDGVEVAERCRAWRDLGQWTSNLTIPSYSTEILIMPIVNANWRMPHKHFLVQNIHSTYNLLCDTEGTNYYSQPFTWNSGTKTLTLGNTTLGGNWSQVKFYVYAK
jgi:hypothetical protein